MGRGILSDVDASADRALSPVRRAVVFLLFVLKTKRWFALSGIWRAQTS